MAKMLSAYSIRVETIRIQKPITMSLKGDDKGKDVLKSHLGCKQNESPTFIFAQVIHVVEFCYFGLIA